MIYFISSSTDSLLIEYKKKVESKHVEIIGNSANIINYDSSNIDNLANIIRTENMFEQKRLIIINNSHLGTISSVQDLREIIKLDKAELTIVILHKIIKTIDDIEQFSSSQNSDKNLKYTKLPTPSALKLIDKYLINKSIEPRAKQELIKIGNLSLDILIKELEKLSNLEEITIQDIADFSYLYQDKNYQLALQVINKPLNFIPDIRGKVAENFQAFLGLLSWQLKTLIILSSPLKKQTELLKKYPIKEFVIKNSRIYSGADQLMRYQAQLISLNDLNCAVLAGEIDPKLIWINLLNILCHGWVRGSDNSDKNTFLVKQA